MKRFAMGWLPDRADFRDHTPADSGVARKLKSAAFPKGAKAAPRSVDLRPWCSPVEDQGELGSCTAQAGAGLLEYYWLRANGELLDISRLFLYRTTRRLMGWNGDTGAFLRDTMKAMVVFGVPPEQYWPYAIARFDDEPEAFCYAFAQNYKSLEYYRLDPPGSNGADTLTRVKSHLAAGLPSMFGFSVYSSLWNATPDGSIPFPEPGDRMNGGHAVVAVGYDDARIVRHPRTGAKTTGALLIRNSWGINWGEAGYGWLPYEYVQRGLAEDWWALLHAEWTDLGVFAA
ncbi:MAG: C1 family peptidase [Xanthomonadaceae bacterium]|nr:C1 family peptidase [Xanthomonadaceae bacterium]